jgi:sirohydrochlorin cobaltochelatase
MGLNATPPRRAPKEEDEMKTVVVLAMHGVPPNDFPRQEMREFFELHGRMEMSPASLRPASRSRYQELEAKIKHWPRTAQNDPYHTASHELARALQTEIGLEVTVGFNEFCSPDVDEALEQTVGNGAGRIIVLTTMMTRGGEHAEREIAQAVSRARTKHPGVEIIYAWPFETAGIARFLAEHVRRFVPAP